MYANAKGVFANVGDMFKSVEGLKLKDSYKLEIYNSNIKYETENYVGDNYEYNTVLHIGHTEMQNVSKYLTNKWLTAVK